MLFTIYRQYIFFLALILTVCMVCVYDECMCVMCTCVYRCDCSLPWQCRRERTRALRVGKWPLDPLGCLLHPSQAIICLSLMCSIPHTQHGNLGTKLFLLKAQEGSRQLSFPALSFQGHTLAPRDISQGQTIEHRTDWPTRKNKPQVISVSSTLRCR